MQRRVDEVIDFDRRSIAHVRIWRPAGSPGRPIVLLGELEDNPGRSLTNAIEQAAEAVAERWLDSRSADVDWFEYFPPSSLGPSDAFSCVTFEIASRQSVVRRSSNDLTDPKWFDLPRAQFEGLVGEPVEVYAEGTYTAPNVRLVRASPRRSAPVEWDPHGLRDDALAVRHLLGPSESASLPSDALLIGARAIAFPSRAKLAYIDKEVADQDATTAVQKRSPVLAAIEWRLLDDLIEHGPLDPDDMAAALREIRLHLSRVDASARLRLRPSPFGLSWRDKWGTSLAPEDDQRPLIEDTLSAIRHAEDRLSSVLWSSGASFLEDDRPFSIPSASLDRQDPCLGRYLDTVAWWGPSESDSTRADQLAHELEGPVVRFGYDPWGRLVAEGTEAVSVEWPLRAHPHDPPPRRVVGHTGLGHQPVFIELADGRLDPLPAALDEAYAPDFTWGYYGNGPHALTQALYRTVTGFSEPSRDDINRLYELVAAQPAELSVPFEEVTAACSHR